MKYFLTLIRAFCFFLAVSLSSSHQCLAEETTPETKNPDPSFSSVEERRILTKMREEQTGVDESMSGLKEKELKTLNEEADKKLGEINRKLEELQGLEKNLKAQLAQKDAQEAKKIKELGKIYEKMAPDKAALALSNMDDKLATELLGTMKPRSAAKILNVLDRKKTSELSTTFSTTK
jgi:flagellar motility protein MotE (MotC chaperone)